MNPVIIDVREKDEFDAEHIADAIHVPLSDFTRRAPALLKSLQGRPVVLICLGGKRAAMAATQAAGFAAEVEISVFAGGLTEWKRQGKPTVASGRTRLPIMRQVQLIAGSLVLGGVLLASFVHPSFIFLPGFVGTGLIVAGATGFCGMAEILSRLPWNKA